ncbi:MAG: hypothetical protein ACXACG_19085 [Candidatus Thorarchaeota archaeon]|jgi:hypothetical protein
MTLRALEGNTPGIPRLKQVVGVIGIIVATIAVVGIFGGTRNFTTPSGPPFVYYGEYVFFADIAAIIYFLGLGDIYYQYGRTRFRRTGYTIAILATLLSLVAVISLFMFSWTILSDPLLWPSTLMWWNVQAWFLAAMFFVIGIHGFSVFYHGGRKFSSHAVLGFFALLVALYALLIGLGIATSWVPMFTYMNRPFILVLMIVPSILEMLKKSVPGIEW